MKQKFRQLTRVHVCKEMPLSMRHFQSDFDAIVQGTYSQLHGGMNIDLYALYIMEGGRVVDMTAWYHEDQLTALPKQNRIRTEELIEAYHFRR